FLVIADLADIVDAGRAEQRLDLRLVIFDIDLIDLSGDLKRQAAASRDRDGDIGRLLGADPAEEGKIALRCRLGLQKLRRQAVMDRSHPAGIGYWLALCVRDRDHWRCRKGTEHCLM